MKIKSKKASKKLNVLSEDLVKASYLREKAVQNSPVKNSRQDYNNTVSYKHLTLPTISDV